MFLRLSESDLKFWPQACFFQSNAGQPNLRLELWCIPFTPEVVKLAVRKWNVTFELWQSICKSEKWAASFVVSIVSSYRHKTAHYGTVGVWKHTNNMCTGTDVAQHCWRNFLMTQEADQVLNEQNNARLSHRAEKGGSRTGLWSQRCPSSSDFST